MMTTNNFTDKYFSEEARQAIVFEHKNLDNTQVEDIHYMKRQAATLYDFIRSRKNNTNQRTTALALTNLEMAVMFATKAITQEDEQVSN